MNYYITTTIEETFENSISKVTEELKKQGFGIITQIDMKETLKKKLDVDFKKYTILGACNPSFAYKALQVEEKIGTMLPCNVIIIEKSEHSTEVSAINPMVSMQTVNNPLLHELGAQVSSSLEKMIEALKS